MFDLTQKNEENWRKEGRRKTDMKVIVRGIEKTDPDEIAKINWTAGYFNPSHPHRDLIINILKKNPVRSVLEVGCGVGANLYRIKKEFPDIPVAGCDINEDAIAVAKEMFAKEFPAGQEYKKVEREYAENPLRKAQRELVGGISYRDVPLPDIEFRVGRADSIPFNGDSFDLVLTDALLLYIGPKKIARVLREIRRVGYGKMMFVEAHSKSFMARFMIRTNLKLYAYDYEKLLAENYFKYILLHKFPNGTWMGEPWQSFGYVITALR